MESPRATSYSKYERPIDQCAAAPSGRQPMKSPPMYVRRRVGTADDAATETVAGVPPTGGTVIMKTLRFARTSARLPSGESTTSSGAPPLPGTPAMGAVTFTTVRTSVPS